MPEIRANSVITEPITRSYKNASHCLCFERRVKFVRSLQWFPSLIYEQLARIGISNMALDQLKEFLQKMQSEPALKEEVLGKSTADDVARVALKLGFEFSGDELLRFSGQKVGKVTVKKNDIPGEYN